MGGESRVRVVFVCTGNICRSPMAEVIARRAFHDAGLGDRVTVSSVGTGDWHVGNGMDARAAAELAAHGYDTGHVASQLSPGDHDADLVVACDGVNSAMRRQLGAGVVTEIDVRPNRFVWLGTSKPFPAFTFYFRSSPHGLWRVHAYQYAPGQSTFIVECSEATWRGLGLDRMEQPEAIALYLSEGYAEIPAFGFYAGHELARSYGKRI